MRRITWAMCWLILGTGLVTAVWAQSAEEDQKKLQGTWTASKAERDGKAADDVVGHRLSFADGNRFQIQSKDGKTLYAGTYRLVPNFKPAAIDFEHTEGTLKGKAWKGIYALEGNTLKICDNAPSLDKDRPTAFEAKASSGHVFITFVRASDERSRECLYDFGPIAPSPAELWNGGARAARQSPNVKPRPPARRDVSIETLERPRTPSVSQLRVLAPLSGQVWPLERVPDPVFAQKMVGDGLSIDPTDAVLVAACDGEVVALHAAGHAVTLRTPAGIEVLMHIGIDTVTLKGEGFRPRVSIGSKVHAGDELIAFDLDFVATHAKSLLTQVVIANPERVTAWERASGLVSAGKDTLFTITFGEDAAAADANAGGKTITSQAIVIPNPTGLHARPAAVLASMAKGFQSAVKLQCGDRQANARSVTAILALDVSHGTKVQVVASGPDAAAAVEKLAEVLANGCGDEGCTPAPAPATTTVSPAAAPPPRRRKSSDPNVLLGVAASPGLAVGEVFQIRRAEIEVVEAGKSVDAERRRLVAAIAASEGQLAALRAQLNSKSEPAKAAIFAAHEELLADPDLLDVAESLIAKGKSAPFAWKQAVTTHADRLAGLRNELLAQRANDLRDVGLRVLAQLTGAEIGPPQYPSNAVLIAEDLTPSDTAAMDRSRVMGFCTTRGGATSHVAILARSLGIPALAGVEPAALELANGTLAILDGNKGTLRVHATQAEVARIRRAQERAEQRRKANFARAPEPAVMLDGTRIEVLANIGGVNDAGQVAELGGEGVGLLRSEFLFMERRDAPTEEQQFENYRSIVQAVGASHPVIIRTLDVGGDKPLSYLPIPKEDNPFLGERGVRVGLDRPEILRTQLRAILRAGAFGRVRVMFPMIATLGELRDVKAILAEEAANLGVPPVPAGIMVEVPATAVMAAQFAREADFFSIGTNDLTQYTLAMDRGHPKLAPQVDGLSPAVLHLIAHTVRGARASGRPVHVGVCGGIASDPSAVPILIGIGVDELSVSLPAIPAVKAQIRTLRLDDCRKLAELALAADSAADVRALVPNPDADEDAGTETAETGS